MFYGSLCGINVNLIKATFIVGVVDIISTLTEYFIDIEHIFKYYDINKIVIITLIMTLGIVSAVLLIRGAQTMKKGLLVLWLVFSAIRILLYIFAGIFLVSMMLHEYIIFFFLNEALEFVPLVMGFIIVWQLYFAIRARNNENFSPIDDPV